jgi:CelD/BcsL family acetyltransferase involved in cellulose biosynthesis
MNAFPAIPAAADVDKLGIAGGLRLRLTHDMLSVEASWRHLDLHGVSTFYQNFDWCCVWMEHVGKHRDITPLIVIGESVFGDVCFILPLQLRRKAGFRIVETLTTPQGAYAFGLFKTQFIADEAHNWFRDHWSNIVAALPAHDVLRMADAPEVVAGFANPLVAAGSFLAANISHIMQLQEDFETLMENKRSRETRRTIRKRDNKLKASGDMLFGLPETEADTTEVINVMFQDQEKRLAESGIHEVFSQEERHFIQALAKVRHDTALLMRPYTLRIDGVIQSVLLGAFHNKTYWALIISLADGPFRRFSPGDYVLRGAFKALGQEGGRLVDFSAGDAQYKSYWSDRVVPLHLVVRASSMRGLVLAGLMLAREKTKRLVKTIPVLRQSAFALRRIIAGR